MCPPCGEPTAGCRREDAPAEPREERDRSPAALAAEALREGGAEAEAAG